MGARIGVVGLGRIGSYHARNLLTLNGVDALVVTDVDARRTSDVASELDVESAADPDALLASGIDGVLIAASSSSHADLIEAAVRRDIPTFCEKPVADSIESSVRVLATAEQTSVPVQIGFQRRFDPSFVAAYDAVRSGELGWIHTLRSTTLDPAPPPISYIEHSGGIFRDCSIHDFATTSHATNFLTPSFWVVIACMRACQVAAMRSCSFTMSMPVTSSVTGCSTCTRVFISMK